MLLRKKEGRGREGRKQINEHAYMPDKKNFSNPQLTTGTPLRHVHREPIHVVWNH